jgi:hypothetical protein
MICWLLASLLIPNAFVSGQAPDSNTKKASRVVQGTAEPAFRIEPVIQKLRGRAGDVLSVQFEIQAGGKPSVIRVAPIALKQFEDGSILFDPTAPIQEGLQIVSPTVINMEAGQKTAIECIVTVPHSDSAFHSFGILVQDEGQLSDNSNVDTLDVLPRILFKTQYVLRCDVLVEGRKADSASVLELSDANCQEFQGKPVLHVRLKNPANTPIEFKAEITYGVAGSGGKKRTIGMSTIGRRTMLTQDRYTTRILANSEIILEAIPEDFLFPANYEGEVTLHVLGKLVKRQKVRFNVPRNKFSAQDMNMREICDGVVAHPVQLVVSHRRGEKRVAEFQVENYSARTRSVSLKAFDSNGQEVKDVKIRPNEITLGSGIQKRISVAISGIPEERNRYVTLDIVPEPIEGEESKVAKLNLGLLAGKAKPQQVTISDLQFVSDPSQPCYVTQVVNSGDTHVPIFAEIIIRNLQTNQEIAFEYGWGKWLLPGKEFDLRFPIPDELPEGRYEVECLLKNLDAPLSKKAPLTIGTAKPEQSALEGSQSQSG